MRKWGERCMRHVHVTCECIMCCGRNWKFWVMQVVQSPNSLTFSGGWKVDFYGKAVFSKLRVYSKAYSGYRFCVLCFKDDFVLTVWKNIKLDKINLHLHFILKKYLQTYLEALNSHFQPNRHFKILKNSGSVIKRLGQEIRIVLKWYGLIGLG